MRSRSRAQSLARSLGYGGGLIAIVMLSGMPVGARQQAPSGAIRPVVSGSRAAGVQFPAIPASQPWTQMVSDVPAADDVRFGTLPNGMRYAIMHNATPPGQASIWVRIDAGSLMEKDDQLGLAHFMEHMAFNGTRDIPKNEMIHMLERLGLAFGADLNAATGFDQTYYQLNMPRSDTATLDTAVHVLRQQVSAAVMDPQAIIDERGVIAGEERLRNTPGLRVAHRQIDIIAKGQKIGQRFPIGDLKIINSAPRDRFVDYYDAYYRPTRATLIAVGDFDVDAMEARVKAQFGDWEPKAKNGPDPDLGKVAPHGQETHLIVEPGVSSTVSLTWVSPPDLRPDMLALRNEGIVRSLAAAVLNRRLGELSREDDPPFVAAGASRYTMTRSVDVGSITAQYVTGKWQRALTTIEQEQRRIVQYGVSQAELEREIVNFRSRYKAAAASASTRNTRALASAITGAVNDREVFVTPQTELDLFEKATKTVTVAQVNGELQKLFAGAGPILILQSPATIAGGEQAVTSVYAAAHGVTIAASAAIEKKPWPYTDFGQPGRVVSRAELPDLGITKVGFANGVTLWIKPTAFTKDSIGINVLFGNGELNFPSDRIDARETAIGTLREGGLGKLTADELSRSIAGHNVAAGFSVADNRFAIAGSTNQADFDLQMQLLAAYATDPAYRSGPFNRLKASYPQTIEMARSTPAGAFSLGARALLAGGDKREAYPDPAMVDSWTMEPIRDDLKAMVAKGPLHINIVGDVTVDQAVASVASTFGALPSRAPAPAPAADALIRRFPAPEAKPLTFKHAGVAEQSLGYVAWPTTDIVDSRAEARRIGLLSAVLRLRVLDEIREKQALAYSPGVSTSYSDTFRGYGSIAVQAQTSPEKLDAFFTAVDGIVKQLRDQPIGADELQRAREPMVEAARRNLNTNAFWNVELNYLSRRPDAAKETLSTVADLERITPADIQTLARKYLRSEIAWRAEVVPGLAPGEKVAAAVRP